jgi:hypothetical protein
MKDKGLIVIGLVVFTLIAISPFLYNFGNAAARPEIVLSEKAKAAKACVMPKAYMTSEHMQLLDQWRNEVVRNGQRIFETPNHPAQKQFVMSLSNTCLDCHSNKAEFCDRCHNHASVRPYCWDCHIDKPKEME